MRTTEIKDKVIAKTLRHSAACATRAAVAEGVQAYLKIRRQSGIRRLRGKVRWEGDLDAMRGATSTASDVSSCR